MQNILTRKTQEHSGLRKLRRQRLGFEEGGSGNSWDKVPERRSLQRKNFQNLHRDLLDLWLNTSPHKHRVKFHIAGKEQLPEYVN